MNNLNIRSLFCLETYFLKIGNKRGNIVLCTGSSEALSQRPNYDLAHYYDISILSKISNGAMAIYLEEDSIECSQYYFKGKMFLRFVQPTVQQTKT